jgi:hypothetical protein
MELGVSDDSSTDIIVTRSLDKRLFDGLKDTFDFTLKGVSDPIVLAKCAAGDNDACVQVAKNTGTIPP